MKNEKPRFSNQQFNHLTIQQLTIDDSRLTKHSIK